jgi:mono/diheme cytochrome c family protein
MRSVVFVVAAAAIGSTLLFASVGGNAQDAPGSTASVTIPTEGRKLYEEICQACHMADAKGGAGAGAGIPALANNAKLAERDYGITLLLKGRGGMPWFTDMLTPAQMAAVLTYVRSHFNAYPDPVTEADVKRVAAGMPKREACETCG